MAGKFSDTAVRFVTTQSLFGGRFLRVVFEYKALSLNHLMLEQDNEVLEHIGSTDIVKNTILAKCDLSNKPSEHCHAVTSISGALVSINLSQ